MSASANKAREIFIELVGQVPPEQWGSRLAELAGQDQELRARVAALLAAHRKADSLLERPAVTLGEADEVSPASDSADAAPRESAATEQLGVVLAGRYKLLEEIGEGGFGVVYMAEQVEPVQRKVALKIIKAGMDTREVVARFEAERQALALMDHPNIARVFDGGATETGRPYFVMELVQGIPITDFCDQRNVPLSERLKLFIQVCHAVQHAHQKGIIHRDLKPSNILVTLVDGKPLPKVIDFGVAKALAQKLTKQTLFTGFLRMVGTPAYMSPEQADLSGVDIDTRADIYALGVLLYELLTGVTPFDSETLRRAALDEVRRMIRETEPPKPSTRLQTLGEKLTEVARHRQIEPAALPKLVRGDLDWIVMKCLEKERNRRYETANGLAEDIERHTNQEPVLACPPSAGYRLRKFARRNRTLLTTVGFIGLILLLAAFVSTWQAVRATRAFRSAIAARAEAERAAAEAEAVSDFLVDDLLGSASPEKTLGREVTVKEVLENAERTIDTAFKDQPLREAAVRHSLGMVYTSLGQYETAERHARQAVKLRTELLGANNPDAAASMSSLGTALRLQGKVEEAHRLHEEALAIQERVFGPENRETLGSMNHLGTDLRLLGKLEEAERLYEQTVAIQKRVLGPEDPDTLGTMHNLAVTRALLGRLETDCNENGVEDGDDISTGTSRDCNGNGVPDECEPSVGGALSFDGVNDYVNVPDSRSLRIGGTVTIEFWAKRQAFDVDIVLEKGGDWNGPPCNYGVGLHNRGEGRLFYFYCEGVWRSTPGVNDLEWHHYAVVATHGQVLPFMYIDGVQKVVDIGAGATINLNTTSAEPLHIGAQLKYGYFGNNVLDEVRIWNVARSQSEIQENMGRRLPSSEMTGLVGYWQFEEKRQDWQHVWDSSRYGNHGTLGANAAPGDDDPTRLSCGAGDFDLDGVADTKEQGPDGSDPE